MSPTKSPILSKEASLNLLSKKVFGTIDDRVQKNKHYINDNMTPVPHHALQIKRKENSPIHSETPNQLNPNFSLPALGHFPNGKNDQEQIVFEDIFIRHRKKRLDEIVEKGVKNQKKR
jgi:hypothetical protein